jgi:hypothetical protein
MTKNLNVVRRDETREEMNGMGRERSFKREEDFEGLQEGEELLGLWEWGARRVSDSASLGQPDITC